MLRDLMTTINKTHDSTYKAHKALVKGMAVIKGIGGKTADLVGTDLHEVYFVDRENIAQGINASRPVMADYDTEFENIKEGYDLKLTKYFTGEQFATDQVEGTPTEGKYLTVKDNKLAISETATIFICRGAYVDCGKTLYAVEVI